MSKNSPPHLPQTPPTSEFSLIARYFARPTPQAVLGPGDDCALFAPTPGMQLAVTTDMLVAGTHFFPHTDPEQLGWKSLAVNLSDLAAMGAKPRWILLAGSLPEANASWLAAFSRGLFACATAFGVDLIGGDTTRGPLNLCLTALGEVPPGKALRRDNAQENDDLWVSGQVGLAALGLAHLQSKTVLPDVLAKRCLHALHSPMPRVELGLALRENNLAHAAIDISDGLLADLGHIAERSALNAHVFLTHLPTLPSAADATLARQCQLAGGDDYELLFSALPENRHKIAELAQKIDLPLYRIGQMVHSQNDTGKVHLIDENAAIVPVTRQGFDHFG